MKDIDATELTAMIDIGRGIWLSPVGVADAGPQAALIQADLDHFDHFDHFDHLGQFLPPGMPRARVWRRPELSSRRHAPSG